MKTNKDTVVINLGHSEPQTDDDGIPNATFSGNSSLIGIGNLKIMRFTAQFAADAYIGTRGDGGEISAMSPEATIELATGSRAAQH